ncbi:MAG TPA: serine/threonine-protein kinase, partial [Nannocystaceae bacterium]|nr:serine/threonine-protein kinase [Nannocystaceae bacterium]
MNLPATESTHPAPEPRPDLSAEAMRRRLRASLFGDPIAPLMIARFEVLDTLGEGGMGIVHAALDPELDRVVAIKVIRDDRDDRYRDRLLREARALARVSHPNVVQVHEVGETSEGVFIAMEYVPGTTLGRWLQAAPRGLDEILDKFTEAARGLAAAHRAGLVHRDFKPANALVGEDGRVRIADFGLARPVGPPHASPSSPHLRSTLRRRGSGDSDTDTGVVAGTPAYMPPEQLRGLDVDARSDVFAFCIALYEATH